MEQAEFSAHPLHPKTHDRAAIDWYIFFQSFRVSFYSDKNGCDILDYKCNEHYFVLDELFRVFFMDTINFCFWYEEEGRHYDVSYNGVKYTGYFAACAAVNKVGHSFAFSLTKLYLSVHISNCHPRQQEHYHFVL